MTNSLPPIKAQPIYANRSAAEKRQQLALRLGQTPALLAPGIQDGFSAKVADSLGAEALYLTGYGTSGSLLAKPDAGFLTLRDMEARVRTLAAATNAPMIADADTGFGGLPQVAETMRAYEAGGVAAIQIEDQVMPKRCGHTLGREVVDTIDMVRKVKAALDARDDPNCLLIARTDARTAHGFDEACRRMEVYGEAGADILFFESPESEEEFRQIGERFKGAKLLANMVPGGRSPDLDVETLTEMGFALVIHPGATMGPAVAAMREAVAKLMETGSSKGTGFDADAFEGLHRLMGFEEIWAQDAKHAEEDQ